MTKEQKTYLCQCHPDFHVPEDAILYPMLLRQLPETIWQADSSGEDDANWNDYVNRYCQQYREFYAKILKTIPDVNPDISVVVNWEWSARLPNQPLPYARLLVGDLFTGGTVASFYSHYWTGTGLPFDYLSFNLASLHIMSSFLISDYFADQAN